MSVHKHFRDAAHWIAKAPPFPSAGEVTPVVAGVVLRFPIERARQGRRAWQGDAR